MLGRDADAALMLQSLNMTWESADA